MDARDHGQWRMLGHDFSPDVAVACADVTPDDLRHVAMRDLDGRKQLSVTRVGDGHYRLMTWTQFDNPILPDERFGASFCDAAAAESAFVRAVGPALAAARKAAPAISGRDWSFAGVDLPRGLSAVAPDRHRGGCLRLVAFARGNDRREVALEPARGDRWRLASRLHGPAHGDPPEDDGRTFGTDGSADRAWAALVREEVLLASKDLGRTGGPASHGRARFLGSMDVDGDALTLRLTREGVVAFGGSGPSPGDFVGVRQPPGSAMSVSEGTVTVEVMRGPTFTFGLPDVVAAARNDGELVVEATRPAEDEDCRAPAP